MKPKFNVFTRSPAKIPPSSDVDLSPLFSDENKNMQQYCKVLSTSTVRYLSQSLLASIRCNFIDKYVFGCKWCIRDAETVIDFLKVIFPMILSIAVEAKDDGALRSRAITRSGPGHD